MTIDYGKVSIIIPVYNVEKYIGETLDSIINQTYSNWECICVDDCSTDNSMQVVNRYHAKDDRIITAKLNKNRGAAAARNKAIEMATGKYLAFIDSDDLWKPQKLQTQLKFMEENNYIFTCTSYGKVDENSKVLKKECHALQKYDYNLVLKKCPGNSTIIYNCEIIGKIFGPDIRKRNDFAMWLQVIKKSKYAYGIDKILGYHRIRSDSISINKRKLINYQWYVYRNIEKLSFSKSLYYTLYKIIQTILDKNG